MQLNLYVTHKAIYRFKWAIKYMKYINLKTFFLGLVLVLCVVLFNKYARAEAATSTGGIVVVQNYRGAPFTWERWLKPVIYVWVEAGKTLVCVFNPNTTNINTCN